MCTTSIQAPQLLYVYCASLYIRETDLNIHKCFLQKQPAWDMNKKTKIEFGASVVHLHGSVLLSW